MRRGSTRLLRLSSREALKAGPGGGPALLFVGRPGIPQQGDGGTAFIEHDPYTRTGRLGRRDGQGAYI
jgi:hypothetical protein